jgi:hypothetical protein
MLCSLGYSLLVQPVPLLQLMLAVLQSRPLTPVRTLAVMVTAPWVAA